jgi:outer membrane receptor for ferrienterochelin and colicins
MFKFLICTIWLFPAQLMAQTIRGTISNTQNQPLVGATIKWMGAATAVRSNEKGVFSIAKSNNNSSLLVASHSGYVTDTLPVTADTVVLIRLRSKGDLTEVIVTAEKEGIVLSNRTDAKVEVLTSVELKKAACCDLAGCFETQGSVQSQTTNIITNAKELRILGLSGVYNQVLIDGFPMIQGLSFTYGISSVPGPIVDNIYISKGANSVLQGFESISGQINVETKKPDAKEKLFVNVYMNSFLEKHLNIIGNVKVNKWQNLLAFHTVQPANKIDNDKDFFLDLPLLTRYMLLNKWKYGKEREWGWSSEIAVRLLNENRTGGQVFFNTQKDKGSSSVYGNTVALNQIDFWQKTNYRFNDVHRLTLYKSGFQQNQQSFFGSLSYKARQQNGFINLQHEFNIAPNNTLKSGISYKHLQLTETILFTDNFIPRNYAGTYNNNENIVGFFAENVLSLFKDKLTWIAGMRADKHNNFGWQCTPRTLLKYDPTPKLTLRANAGLGWRTVNFFSENIGLLASSRDVVFAERLRPEKAFNAGINITQKFEAANVSGYISADFYHTDFSNQIFPDYDTDPTKAFIKNYGGTSISNGFQADVFLKLHKIVEIKLGYNYLDVYRIVNGRKEVLPFNAKHKLLATLSYKAFNNKLHIDANAHWFGQQRLPNTKANPAIYQRPDFSNPYTTIAAQVTYRFKKMELYGGCENIFDFRQAQPIISWQNPFSNYFDISSVWGPTRGRELYLGVRWTFKNSATK